MTAVSESDGTEGFQRWTEAAPLTCELEGNSSRRVGSEDAGGTPHADVLQRCSSAEAHVGNPSAFTTMCHFCSVVGGFLSVVL